MIEQFLSNKNESATLPFFTVFSELNKASERNDPTRPAAGCSRAGAASRSR
jgi:hypothetical protein